MLLAKNVFIFVSIMTNKSMSIQEMKMANHTRKLSELLGREVISFPDACKTTGVNAFAISKAAEEMDVEVINHKNIRFFDKERMPDIVEFLSEYEIKTREGINPAGRVKVSEQTWNALKKATKLFSDLWGENISISQCIEYLARQPFMKDSPRKKPSYVVPSRNALISVCTETLEVLDSLKDCWGENVSDAINSIGHVLIVAEFKREYIFKNTR